MIILTRTVMLVTFLLLTLLIMSFPARSQSTANAVYEVYALSYGVYPGYSVSALVAGADKSRKADLQMMIWLIKGPGRKNILVDTGCYHDRFVKGQGIKEFIKPSEALAKIGLSPGDITDIIISHMHWDHADGIDLFPNAKVWIQKDEYTYYTGAAWQPGGQHGGIDPDDVLTLV